MRITAVAEIIDRLLGRPAHSATARRIVSIGS
jgi:hypothetical protein